MSQPRIVVQGELWRVIAVELPDPNGVVRTEYVVQLTDANDKSHYGPFTTWRELKDSSAHGDHIRCWRYFLDELLKANGEKPHGRKS